MKKRKCKQDLSLENICNKDYRLLPRKYKNFKKNKKTGKQLEEKYAKEINKI